MISRRALLALPAFLAASCSRKQAAFRGYAFIANQEGGTIAAVDLEVLAVAKHIPVEGAPSQVVSANTRASVYALTPASGTVHEIDTGALKLTRNVTVAAPADSMHLSGDEKTLYVISREAQTLSAIAAETLKTAWTMKLPEVPVDFAISIDDETAAVTSAQSVRLINLKARAVGEPLGQGNFGQVKFLANGERIIAADLDRNQISIYRVSSPRLITHLPIAVKPENLCFNQDGGQLFVTGSGRDAVVILYPYDIPEVAETILAGHAPGAMTASSSFLFLTNSASGDVSVLNIASHKVVAVLPVGSDPGQVAITPDEVFALVLNRESGNVTVLNVEAIQPGRVSAAAALVTVIPVGSKPVSAAMHSV